ncbi:penicillin-binding protein 6 [Methylophilaceae bacterium 11]|jgi:D-alanyl-D-alanine carboxypeptidase (penicillin-binding protein 5/6)|uniref:D-alanyl-D-alanine carboxypeptidase family protein n=1 Tax=Methylotenera sp. N17 TaxID=1502761 RepID=UPI0004533801|nr:D-alanyl-D-alanine carboxypeptidase family protein [Methylotenera sp. N17]EUJ11693.1 penicillin-binding protein 6 [Methylophilaceae bacterium 11]
MMRTLTQTLLFTFGCLIAASSHAEVTPPPNLAVNAYILKDFNSGSIVAGYKENERVEPASLTKIMTAYLAFEAIQNRYLKLDQTLPVSEKAWKVEGSKMFIEPNKPVAVDELLHGLIIQSGNDASITLAEGIAGSEEQFADLMNKKAAKLGMKNTHYMNATGLPDAQHYTTAYDLSLLASALIRDFPLDYKRLYSMKEYTYNKITQPNRNRLLWLDANVDGMKTGHTESAGYCLIASSKRSDSRLISVVLGAVSEASRAIESQKLLNYGFQFFESTLVYRQGQPINALRVWKGNEKLVNATVAQDVYFSLPKGDYARVKASMTSQQPLIAPVKANQVVGKITFTLDGKKLTERALIASKAVESGGFFSRILDSIKLMWQ